MTTDDLTRPEDRKLNLGSGDDYREDFHNVDIDDSIPVDQVLNLEKTPWPWPDNYFEHVLVDNVFEHINPRARPSFLSETYRIMKPGASMVVRMPTRTGWEITHYAVPLYTWPRNPTYSHMWDIVDIEVKRSSIGRFLPKSFILFLTKKSVIWCAREIGVEVKKSG